MQKLLIVLSIGAVAGALDVVPMILRKAEIHQIASAFAHWVVVTLFIAYMSTPLPPWLRGMGVAVLASIPVLIGYSKSNPQSVLPILAISIVLGAVVGVATSRLAA